MFSLEALCGVRALMTPRCALLPLSDSSALGVAKGVMGLRAASLGSVQALLLMVHPLDQLPLVTVSLCPVPSSVTQDDKTTIPTSKIDYGD